MHKYLRAIGFSEVKSKKDLKKILKKVVLNPNKKDFMDVDPNCMLVEYSTLFSPSTGIILRGELDEKDKLTMDFYYPMCTGRNVSTNEETSIERHSARESFGGLCEDNRLGVSLIYYLQNQMEYMKESEMGRSMKPSIAFSGLSTQGKIMLPILKNDKEKKKIKEMAVARTQLIEAAKHGDENAMENLTLGEIDTYTMLSKRIHKEDVFSLVDSYFMPYGLECDLYSILGEIEDVWEETNIYTKEKIYVLDLNCNGMLFTICINAKDLLGEPLQGKRFKGSIWLQGKLQYSSL